jgi:hypothetical protein
LVPEPATQGEERARVRPKRIVALLYDSFLESVGVVVAGQLTGLLQQGELFFIFFPYLF